MPLGLPCKEGLCRTWALEGGAWKQQGQEVNSCLGQEKFSSLPGRRGPWAAPPTSARSQDSLSSSKPELEKVPAVFASQVSNHFLSSPDLSEGCHVVRVR